MDPRLDQPPSPSSQPLIDVVSPADEVPAPSSPEPSSSAMVPAPSSPGSLLHDEHCNHTSPHASSVPPPCPPLMRHQSPTSCIDLAPPNACKNVLDEIHWSTDLFGIVLFDLRLTLVLFEFGIWWEFVQTMAARNYRKLGVAVARISVNGANHVFIMKMISERLIRLDYGELGIEETDIFVSDGAKCDISLLHVTFLVPKCKITVQDPSHPAYEDSCLIMKQTCSNCH